MFVCGVAVLHPSIQRIKERIHVFSVPRRVCVSQKYTELLDVRFSSLPVRIYINKYLFKILIYPALYNIYTGRACTCSTEKNIRLLGEMFVCCVAAPYLCVEKENRKMHVWGPVAGGVGYMM